MPEQEIKIDINRYEIDWEDAYRKIMEQAAATALAADGMDFTDSNSIVATARLAAEIREGLAAGLIRPSMVVAARRPPVVCCAVFHPTREDYLEHHPEGQPPASNWGYRPDGRYGPADPPRVHCTFCLQPGHTADAHGPGIGTGATCCDDAPHPNRNAAVAAHPLRGDGRGERWGPQA